LLIIDWRNPIENLEESVKIDSKARKYKNLRSSSEFIKLKQTDTDELSTTISTTPDDFALIFTSTIENSNNLRLIAIPNVTLYVGSVSEDNIIPPAPELIDIDIPIGGPGIFYFHSVWLDWGSSDNNNLVCKIYISRTEVLASSKTIICRVNWRYIFEDVTTTLTVERVR
jgi:hypothetical protein